MDGPTRGASEPAASTWAARPAVARAVRVVVLLVPFAASLLATWLVRPLLPQPSGFGETLLFFLALAVTAIAAATIFERFARRLLPLASFFELSLVFPDQAPSRYSAALRAGTSRKLAAEVAEVRANRFSPDPGEGPQQVLAMVEALKAHEPLTRGHTERVRAYSAMIAEEMGLKTDDRWRLQWAVLLHDIGKLAVPADILNKDSTLTDDEWATMRTHPEVGAEMAAPLQAWLGDFVHAAGQHHEKFDGNGYPNGLSGHDISLAGRIVAVADAYDVITSARSYKSPMSAEAARRELVDCAGTHFDPTVVKAMLQASVGRAAARSGRLSWLAHLDAIFRPGAIAASAGPAAVGVTMAAVSLVTGGVDGDTGLEETAAPVSIPFSDTTLVTEHETSALPSTSNENSPDEAHDGAGSPAFDDVTSTTANDNLNSTTVAGESSSSTTQPVSGSPKVSSTLEGPGNTAVETTSGGQTQTTRQSTSPPTTAATTTLGTTTTTTSSQCAALVSGQANDFPNAQLQGCDLSGVVLSQVNLEGANLTGADFTGAEISFFNLDGADLSEAVLVDADFLDGSILGADLKNLDATGIEFTRLDVAYTDLSGSDLTGAKISDTSFGFANLSNVQLTGAIFTIVNFNDATMNQANLSNTNATGTEFYRTNLSEAVLQGLNVNLAIFSDANLLAATGTPTNHTAATYSNVTCPNGTTSNSSCW